MDWYKLQDVTGNIIIAIHNYTTIGFVVRKEHKVASR